MAYPGQAVFGGTTDPVTGSWTSASALNSAITSSDITGYGVVVASFSVSGTVSAGTAIFEVSDDGGTTWWPINGLQTGSNAQAMSVSLSSSTSWEFATGAYNLFRARLNPQITGAGTVNVRLSAEAFPFTTAIAVSGTVSVQTVSGSNIVRIQDASGNSLSSTSGSLNVNITGGSSSGTQYANGTAVATPTGTVALGFDGSNVRALLASSTGQLHTIIDSATLGTVTVTGTVAATQSGTWTVQQGTPPWSVSQSGAWNVNQTVGAAGFGKVTDGTNTAAVKPSSTGAAGTDPALVVTMSPNTISVPVTSAPAFSANSSVATWNSGTALNTTAAIIANSDSYQSLIVTLNQTTTITAGQLTFEVSSDGSHWIAITGVDASQFGTFAENGVYFLTPSTYAAGFFNITTWQYFRVRLSTAISGTGAVTIGYSAQSGGQPPVVARQPHNFGRTFICITIADTVITGTQGLVSFNLNKGGVQTTGNTSYTVTSGKTLRLQSVDQVLRSTSGTQPVATFIRSDSGAVTTSSPILWATLQSASTSSYDHAGMTYPDGLEIMSGQQIGITAYNVNGNSTGRITTTIVGYEY